MASQGSPSPETPGAGLPNTSPTSVCPRCGAGFRCGMVAGDAQCWCVQLPHVMPVPALTPSTPPQGSEASADSAAASSCYCPACLQLITTNRAR
ncbi:MAG: cysteine-rich CWC family protein [Polaromonas sp.]|uniref:cysteine-rich CWC family protein n=1 Tax=Polaromonas sp. TaxID=1869339 RepID=UPI0027344F79|nr:cysteine-rich CWC family protein [Polaromonas sp.]MDP3796865.1 cysteine-rich CWC family protein [Polaromonas sp.]